MKLAYLSFLLLSASVLCFEIVATRIASVVFVSDYAYIIVSLAILGLGGGGIAAHFLASRGKRSTGAVHRLFLYLGISFCAFIVAVTSFAITSPVVFIPLLIAPFFLGGMIYARLYGASGTGFTLYATDLIGAVIGAIASIGVISFLGASNAVLLLALVVWGAWALRLSARGSVFAARAVAVGLAVAAGVLFYNGTHDFLGPIAIGHYAEKDIYYVYADPSIRSHVVDSRWSIYGRADLIAYSHQDMVRQMFIDGAAGTQVYRFNGNLQHTNSNLQLLLLHHSNAIPFVCMSDGEKRSLLVIGPGGGKEILIGLLGGVQRITGVEVNPDFVAIVKEQRDFDGGIYTDFPSVNILVDEGRHHVRRMQDSVDLVVMALPSTAQMQNIEPFATNENFLLTTEAIQDYFRVLTPDGKLILTVHNAWELTRLLVTAVSVFQKSGVAVAEIPDHFVVFESEYAPTVVIKKSAFSVQETLHWKEVCGTLPRDFPPVTYLPHGVPGIAPTGLTSLFRKVSPSPASLTSAIAELPQDISPCSDDRPYFYNRARWGPGELLWLLGGIAVCNALVIGRPFAAEGRKRGGPGASRLRLPLLIVSCAGMGFMILEIALLQKLVLWVGSPTTSLSLLLASLLAGMGIGSYLGGRLDSVPPEKILVVALIAIAVTGILHELVSPVVLQSFVQSALVVRLGIAGALMFPLAIVLGIPFPVALKLLRRDGNESYISWMYGVNCSMSVLGSVLAIILSMRMGFLVTFGVGLACYLALIPQAYRGSGAGR